MEPGYSSRKKSERIARQEKARALEELPGTRRLEVDGQEVLGQVSKVDVEQEAEEDEDCSMAT